MTLQERPIRQVSLYPRESGPEVDQGPGVVITPPPVLVPLWSEASSTRLLKTWCVASPPRGAASATRAAISWLFRVGGNDSNRLQRVAPNNQRVAESEVKRPTFPKFPTLNPTQVYFARTRQMYLRRDAGIRKTTASSWSLQVGEFFMWSFEQHSQNLRKLCIYQVGVARSGQSRPTLEVFQQEAKANFACQWQKRFDMFTWYPGP